MLRKRKNGRWPVTVAAVTLKGLLDADSELEKRLEEHGVHRTQLWRFVTQRTLPTMPTGGVIEEVTGGRCKASDWTVEVS